MSTPSERRSSDIPQVRDLRARIEGLLPRDTQTRVLGGVAVLMAGVIAFSGRGASKNSVTPTTPPQATVIMEANQARIQAYRAGIEEDARKLAAAQAELSRSKQQFDGASGSQVPAVGGSSSVSSYSAPAHYDLPSQRTEHSTVSREREKREAEAPFASNIALSFRREPRTKAPVREDAISPPRRANDLDRSTSAPKYPLYEGTWIETALVNRLDGEFSGPVNCLVTTNVYSPDHQKLLIPQGTRVLGEVQRVESFGQQRLAVSFHRMILPNGDSFTLDQWQGLNQTGETGLRDRVNRHYAQIFGVSIAIGLLSSLSQVNTRYGPDQSGTDVYRQGAAASLSQSSMRVLDRFLNVLPTFTIHEGHRIKVYLAGDLLLPEYSEEKTNERRSVP